MDKQARPTLALVVLVHEQLGPFVWAQKKAASRACAEGFCLDSSRDTVSAKNSKPTLQGHPRAASSGFRQKSAFAQPINYNGRRVVIPEERKITQNSQITDVQITLHPRTR
jgi:hypothetical protein